MSTGPALEIRDLRVGFQSRVVLDGLTLDIPSSGIIGMLGPSGVGKSTLLRTLARWTEALPSFWYTGDIVCEGRSLLRDLEISEAHRKVPLLAQKAALYTATVADNLIDGIRGDDVLSQERRIELAHRVLTPLGLWDRYKDVLDDEVLSLSIGRQRIVSIARLLAAGARCLLVDEPLRDLTEEDANTLAGYLRTWSATMPIILTTHNQQVSRFLCSKIYLLVAGKIVESASVEEFYASPKSKLAKDFVRTGSCWIDAQDPGDEVSEEPEEDTRPAPAVTSAPGGFHWVERGRLGGMQRPGLLNPEEDDLRSLAAVGCSKLITLTEVPYANPLLDELGVEVHHFPIDDMKVPDLEEAVALCARVVKWIDEGEVCVFHCKAGLGRTGTLLACVLVMQSKTAVAAVDTVRCVNPYYIQSSEQLAFVSDFQKRVRRRAGESIALDDAVWLAVGKRDGLEAAVERFFQAARSDERIGHYFGTTRRSTFVEHFARFLEQLMTGERCYRGQRLRNAHHLLIIGADELSRWLELLEVELRAAGMSEEQWAALAAGLSELRPDVVKERAIPRVVHGQILPLSGYAARVESRGTDCAACSETIRSGTPFFFHFESQRAYCGQCLPRRSAVFGS